MAIYSISVLGDDLPCYNEESLSATYIYLLSIIGSFVSTASLEGYRRFNFYPNSWINNQGLYVAKVLGFKCFNYGTDKIPDTVHVRKHRRKIEDLIAETDLILSVSKSWDFPYSDLIKSCNTQCKIYNYTEMELFAEELFQSIKFRQIL